MKNLPWHHNYPFSSQDYFLWLWDLYNWIDTNYGYILFWVFSVVVVAAVIIVQLQRVSKRKIAIREELYRELVEGTSAALATLDHNFTCTYVNKTIEEMTGLSVSELVGLPVTEHVHQDDR